MVMNLNKGFGLENGNARAVQFRSAVAPKGPCVCRRLEHRINRLWTSDFMRNSSPQPPRRSTQDHRKPMVDPIVFSVSGNGKGPATAVRDDEDDGNGNRHPLQFRAKQLTHLRRPGSSATAGSSPPGTPPNGICRKRGKRPDGSATIDGDDDEDRKQSVDSMAGMKQAGKRIMLEAWPSPSPVRTRQRCSTARCQVEGCNADLRDGKDYHRRHKVCEIHSKAPKVGLSGLEQRFCQQCSRFHVLSEFDEDKRSCRRRLAGHNERRRKSQPEALPPTRRVVASILPDTNVYGFPDLSLPFQKTEGLSDVGSAFTFKQSRDVVTRQNGKTASLESTGTGNPTLQSTGVDLPSGLDCVRALSLLSSQSNIHTVSSALENNFEDNSLARECLHHPPQRRDGLQQTNTFEHSRRAAPLDTLGRVQNFRWDSLPIPCFQCSESKRIPHLSCGTFDMDFLP